MLGWQSEPRSDRSEVLGVERVAALQVPSDVERAAKHQGALLGGARSELRPPQRLPRTPAFLDQRLQFIGFKGKRGIDAAVRAAQREVLFDHAGAQRDRGECCGDAQRMV